MSRVIAGLRFSAQPEMAVPRKREESPDSRLFGESPRAKGNAPDNVRGPSCKARERRAANGYGKCHREYTAGELRSRRPSFGNTTRRPVSDGAHLVRVKRWGKSPPPGWQHPGHGKPRVEQSQIGGEGRPGPHTSRSKESGVATLG